MTETPLRPVPVESIEYDAIVAEVRSVREAIFARAGYDLQELGRQLQARQAAAGRQGLTLPPKLADGDSGAP